MGTVRVCVWVNPRGVKKSWDNDKDNRFNQVEHNGTKGIIMEWLLNDEI